MYPARSVFGRRRTRVRTFASTTLAVAAFTMALGWHDTVEFVHAKTQVPFRLMEATISETHAALEAGTVTSEDLVRMYLARIDAYDKRGPAINALIRLNPNALADARALDAERRGGRTRGPLHGIPVVLKDNYDTFDMPTSASSKSLATSVAPDDAYLVRRLREAGAVFLGKTNMHEFAFGITTISSLGGQTLNPYDVRRNPGGSSGGTGAAVAANFAVFGMGSDTCGSIRIPSSHNSLVGLRVTQGLTSRDGIIPLSLTQDVGGPLARSVEDIAIVMDATSGFDLNDPITAVSVDHTPGSYTHFLKTGRLRGARFGVLTDAMITVPEDVEVANVIRSAAQELETHGAEVIDVSIPNYTAVSNVSVITFEFKTNLDAYLAATPAAPFKTLQDIFNHPDLWHPSLINALSGALANALKQPDYSQRLGGREVFKNAILKALDDNHLDALIYPTIRQKPNFVTSTSQAGSNCRVSAHSGLPAISVPVGFIPDAATPTGIPVGMEFLGRAFTEGDLLQIAFSWEQETHIRRVPASTPVLEPRWSYHVSDGVASFDLDPAGKQFHFTAPGMDTFVYIDPAMHDVKGTQIGELKDDRWHIRYAVPTSAPGLATIWIDDLWTKDGAYTLFGRAVAR
jgi:Asp-tRNA(Asn)/Glu-tRNA(Gln) amidotransferase A subunit family amidase